MNEPDTLAVGWRIRDARLDDLEVIVRFNLRLAEESEGRRLDEATLAGGVERVLGDARLGRYFLADGRQGPIGQMMITGEWSDWRNGRFWWIQSVYVAPDWRRKSVFRSLYRHVAELARRDPEVVGLRLYVDDHNQSAQQVYQRAGLQAAGYRVFEQLLR